MNNETPIGKQVRERRKALGISQRDLSELAGVSLHTLSDIESGKANPTMATLERVLTPLGMVLSIQVRGVE
jgi:y4mF family transcriptional regulator